MILKHCIVCGAQMEDIPFSDLCKSCRIESDRQKKEFKNQDLIRRKDTVKYKSLMSDKNMHQLFMVRSRGRDEYDSYRDDVFINTVTGIPYVITWHFSSYSFPPGGTTVYSPNPISFYRLIEMATICSDETYEKYKGISEENWIDYIINEI